MNTLGWSEKAVDYYQSFLAPSTLNVYNKYVKMFYEFCVRNSGGFPPPDSERTAIIAEFMCYKAESSERPESMLTTILAALAQLFGSHEPNPIPKCLQNLRLALVKRCTTRAKGRTPIMPVQPLMRLVESWGPNNVISLSKLRQKTLALLALCAMCRPSDLLLNRKDIVFNDDGSATMTFFAIKNDRNRKGFEVRLTPSTNTLVDPIACLKEYLSQTKRHVTDHGDPVFITLQPPFKALSAASIAASLRQTIQEAGLGNDKFTARCFRPSGATAAVRMGNDPEVTRQIGRWKSQDVFYDTYVYPMPSKSFTDTMLSSDIEL